jgi:hypothetical protein
MAEKLIKASDLMLRSRRDKHRNKMQINPMKENTNKFKTRSDILTAVLLRIQVFWTVTLY